MHFKRTKLYPSDNKTKTYKVLQRSNIYSPTIYINNKININIYLLMLNVHTIFLDLRRYEVCRANTRS